MQNEFPLFVSVGVTGGIGSGKSALCDAFRGRGRQVISADLIAREIGDTDDEVKSQIQKTFGRESYLPDGRLDRKRIAAMVFNDSALRERLNGFIHPRVDGVIRERIEALTPSERSPYVVIEAALIFESGMQENLDYTIVVDAPEEVRIARVMARDHCSREQVLQRIKAQMPVEKKVKLADFVLHNDGTEEELKEKAVFLDTLLGTIIRNFP